MKFILLILLLPYYLFGIDHNPRNIDIKKGDIVILGFVKKLDYTINVMKKYGLNGYRIYYVESYITNGEWNYLFAVENDNEQFQEFTKYFRYYYYPSKKDKEKLFNNELVILNDKEVPVPKITINKDNKNTLYNKYSNELKELEDKIDLLNK